MIWLTWRQFRTQAVVVFGLLAALAVVLVATGLHLRQLYDASGITTCKAHNDCDAVTTLFLSHYSLLQQLVAPVIFVLPAVTGVFWGAPLVAAELDSGTFRLAWTQSVTRTRWLATKLAIIGLASVAASGLLSLAITWWASPLDQVRGNRFSPSVFNERNIVPFAYAAFAFALGVAVGLMIRRTLPAMATTLVGYFAVQVAVVTWIRPHLNTPLRDSKLIQERAGTGPQRVGQDLTDPGDWIITRHLVDPSGNVVTDGLRRGPDDACVIAHNCLAGFREAVTFQPANRYWPFQIYETGIYLGLSLVLVALTFWWIRHRLS